MDMQKMSTNGLKSLHAGVAKALAADDAKLKGQDKDYGAREYPDWREWGDALEAELTARAVEFELIDWSEPSPNQVK